MLQNFLYSLNATVPVFAVMVLGWLLKRAGFLTEEFIRTANKLVFHVALPAMLFLDIAQMDPTQLLDGQFVAFGAAVTLVSILLIWLLSRLLMKHKEQVGAFVQGAYRSSAAILGAALITNVYGDAGYAPLMILASVPLYNIFAVLILVLESGGDGRQGGAGVKRATVNVCKNPIILGIVAGMPFALLQLKLPAMVTKTVSLVGQLATPLALLAIGAGFVWQNARLLQTKDLKLYAADCFWTARTKQPAMLFVMHSAKCTRTILKIFRLNPRKWNIVTALYLATRYIQKYSIVSMAIGQHWRDSSAQEVCCV